MVTVDEQLLKFEVAIARLVELNTRFSQSNANHEAQIAELRKQTAALERRADEMERRADATERRADATERRADAMEQNHEELVRFNRQTRRLWIIVARKSNLLDDDEIRKWLEEDL